MEVLYRNDSRGFWPGSLERRQDPVDAAWQRRRPGAGEGDPARTIADIERVEVVFKDGVGYDSRKLIESVRGQVGIRW